MKLCIHGGGVHQGEGNHWMCVHPSSCASVCGATCRCSGGGGPAAAARSKSA